MSQTDKPALVGIVPRKGLWPIILKERWYHIPVASAPRNIKNIRYLAFYFPAEFDEELRHRVVYYSTVRSVKVVKRSKLFPNEPKHPRAGQDYFQINLGQILPLPRPVPSRRFRRIVHIPSSYRRLMTAREVNDLYHTSPLEETMYEALKKKGIRPERQFYVKSPKGDYCLDFLIQCRKTNINVECDGESYHNLPSALSRDRERNNELTSQGWAVLRFSGNQIRKSLPACLALVEKTIRVNKGLTQIGERENQGHPTNNKLTIPKSISQPQSRLNRGHSNCRESQQPGGQGRPHYYVISNP